MTLVEALVAMLIMAFGMLALVGLQSNVRRSADLAKQRGEATRLAQQELELLRAYSLLTRPAGAAATNRDFDTDIVASSNTVLGQNATYTVSRNVDRASFPGRAIVDLTVTWTDRAGDLQPVQLSTVIARIDPALSGSLRVPPDGKPIRRPANRDPAIPPSAKDLGDGISGFKPVPDGTVAWVFNNLSGVITGKCTVPFGTPTSALTAADVESCKNNTFGYLLSGYVRFSAVEPPSSEAPNSTALPLDMVMTVDVGAELTPRYECFDDAPPSAATSMTFVSYNCLVYPTALAPRIWSGQLGLSGIALGGSDWKVCRYSADYNGNGKIDNAEHPLVYDKVEGSLTGQNFLVIKAAASCPLGHGVDPAAGHFSNTRTVQHQPDGV